MTSKIFELFISHGTALLVFFIALFSLTLFLGLWLCRYGWIRAVSYALLTSGLAMLVFIGYCVVATIILRIFHAPVRRDGAKGTSQIIFYVCGLISLIMLLNYGRNLQVAYSAITAYLREIEGGGDINLERSIFGKIRMRFHGSYLPFLMRRDYLKYSDAYCTEVGDDLRRLIFSWYRVLIMAVLVIVAWLG